MKTSCSLRLHPDSLGTGQSQWFCIAVHPFAPLLPAVLLQTPDGGEFGLCSWQGVCTHITISLDSPQLNSSTVLVLLCFRISLGQIRGSFYRWEGHRQVLWVQFQWPIVRGANGIASGKDFTLGLIQNPLKLTMEILSLISVCSGSSPQCISTTSLRSK